MPLKPGWVVPSIVTGEVIIGKGDNRLIVRAPEPMLKLMVSVPGFVLALTMACRKGPAPLSLVLVTTVDPFNPKRPTV